jgi:hypothetical protein
VNQLTAILEQQAKWERIRQRKLTTPCTSKQWYQLIEEALTNVEWN